MTRTRTLSILPADMTAEEGRALVAAVENEEHARAPVRALLGQHRDLVAAIGLRAAVALDALLETLPDRGVLSEEAARAELANLRAEVAEPSDGALERLLVERILLTWLAVTVAEHKRADKWSGGVSAESATFWDRHLTRLNADFLRACRTLATVRRRIGPAVQVNVAQHLSVGALRSPADLASAEAIHLQGGQVDD